MEHISGELNFSLTLFFVVTSAVIGFAGFFLIKIFIECSSLLTSVDKLLELVNYEFVPTLKEIQKTLKHVSSISDKADKHITQLSESIDSASSQTNNAVNKARVSLVSLITGIAEGLKSFIR